MAELRCPASPPEPRRTVRYESQKLSDRRRSKTRINIGPAFARWTEFMEFHGIKSHGDMATFLLDRCAASPQNHYPANEIPHGHPPLMKKDIPDLAPHDVCVNIACLLRLFRRCGQCSGECVVRKYGDKRHFTVIHQCQICSQLTTWTSHPFKEDEEPVDLCEVTEGNREFTACLVMREWCDSKTDTASSREDSILTDEDPPPELALAKESVPLPGEVREGDQESAASLTVRTMGLTDGGPSRETSLLTEDDKKGKDQESKNKSDPFAEVELTIDTDFSDGSQRGQEESDGVGAQEKGEGSVRNKNIEKEEEAEDTAYSETQEEEDDEWEMDDDDDDDDADDDDWEDGVRKARKRLRCDYPSNHYRRMYMIKREQKRPETLCTDCGRVYRTVSHKCDPKKKYQCPDCGRFFLTELSLSVHINGHCRCRKQSCTFCLKPFKTRKDRLTHELSHSGEEPYECSECPQRFLDRSTRSRHLKEHQKSFRCQTCQKDFPYPHLLHRHEMSHSVNKPFGCQVCDHDFAQASQLKSHMRVHTGETPFQCQLCPKRYNHNVSLKNHIKRCHTGESCDSSGSRGTAKLRTGPSRRRLKKRT